MKKTENPLDQFTAEELMASPIFMNRLRSILIDRGYEAIAQNHLQNPNKQHTIHS